MLFMLLLFHHGRQSFSPDSLLLLIWSTLHTRWGLVMMTRRGTIAIVVNQHLTDPCLFLLELSQSTKTLSGCRTTIVYVTNDLIDVQDVLWTIWCLKLYHILLLLWMHWLARLLSFLVPELTIIVVRHILFSLTLLVFIQIVDDFLLFFQISLTRLFRKRIRLRASFTTWDVSFLQCLMINCRWTTDLRGVSPSLLLYNRVVE